MAGSAELVQRFVHSLGSGGPALWIRRLLLAVVFLAVVLIYMYSFRGLATSQAMDQAQIARSLASGHGWNTEFVRPRALGQLQAHGKQNTGRSWVDTYNAPLPPLVNAVFLFPIRAKLAGGIKDSAVYIGDKAIAAVAFLFFFASVVVLFFAVRQIFDQRIALLTCGLTLLGEIFWDYSVSGLPQMLMLFFFNATIYAFIRAVEAHYAGGRLGPWLLALGAGFGLLALSHALTIWMFGIGLLFCAFFFRPRGWAAGIVLVAFLILYTPWLLRNFLITGNPAGAAFYAILDGAGHSETTWMRQFTSGMGGVGLTALRAKVGTNLADQFSSLFKYFGFNIVATSFFFSFLYMFRHRGTNVTRWFLLLLWLGAVTGMAVYGIHEESNVAANQLHLLFLPLLSAYGLAWLFNQWNRLNLRFPFARLAFTIVIFLICAVPMMATLWDLLLGTGRAFARYPPYFAPSLAGINTLMEPNEVVATDMPWAVAWYSDHRALLVPDTPKTMSDLSDYGVLGGPVNALLLTPISSGQNTLGDIVRGDWKEWSPAILRTGGGSMANFPLRNITLLGIEDYLFFTDHDRRAQKSGP